MEHDKHILSFLPLLTMRGVARSKRAVPSYT
jgi:hypothetical protein